MDNDYLNIFLVSMKYTLVLNILQFLHLYISRVVSNFTITINDTRNSVNERSCFLLKKKKKIKRFV